MANLERLQPRWLLPIRPSTTLLSDHDLIHQNGQIIDILPRETANPELNDIFVPAVNAFTTLPALPAVF